MMESLEKLERTRMQFVACFSEAVYMEEGDPSTIKILEGATTFLWAYMHKFPSVWLTVEKELKIKDYPLNNPPLFLCSLSLVLGSSWRRQITWC